MTIGSRRAGIRANRRRIAALLSATLLAIAVTGAARSGSTWDPRIRSIAESVARLRGLSWRHPVEVEFLSDHAFRKRVAAGNEHEAESQARALETTEAQLRALGLASADVDLVKALRTYAGDNILAYYDPNAQRITVRGTDLSPTVRVTVAHELTHALDDQHFALEHLDHTAKTSGQANAVEAIVEGDASRIENGYLGGLSEADRASVEQTEAAWRDQAPAARTESGAPLPEVLGALYDAPYVLGPHLVKALLDAGGDPALARALRTAPPSDEDVYDPLVVAAPHATATVRTPGLERGERRVGTPDDFGALSLYLLLASRLDPLTAMDAANAWAGDAAITFRRDGRECLRVTFAGHDPASTQVLDSALRGVVAQLPGNSAKVGSDVPGSNRVTLTTCDPGKAAVEPAPYADRALSMLDLRNWSATEAVASGLSVPAARCVSGAVVRDPGWSALASPDAEKPTDAQFGALRERYRSIVNTCRAGA